MHPALIYYWYRTPMLRPLVSLSIGILLQWYMPLSLVTLSLIAVMGFGLLLASFWGYDLWRSGSTLVSLLAGAVLFFVMGAWLCIKSDIRNDPRWLGANFIEDHDAVWVYVIDEVPTERKRNYVVAAKALAKYSHNTRYPLRGKLLIHLSKDPPITALQPGDTLLSFTSPTLMMPPQNPGERNWQQAQLMKGITHRLYVDTGQFRLLVCRSVFWKRNLSALQKKILQHLRNAITDPSALGLAQALLIGYRQDLDPVLSRSYSHTGVIHIIAISGMHLALIGGLLNWCLRPLVRGTLAKQLAQLLVLGSLWLFSLLAGGSPSLLRATLLFSTVMLGDIFFRKSNSLNNLMIAGFLLLCYDPFWLWDIGFQLSFTAVAGILLVGRTLSKKLSSSNIVWHAMGQLIAISIAAQLFTTPLSLYYFHQFPGAFLLGNLIAVPLSNIILTGLLLLMAFSPCMPLAAITGKGITYLVMGMNQYVRWVEDIPGLLLTDLQWELRETILLFIMLLAALHWIVNGSHWGRLLTLLTALALVGCQAHLNYRNNRQQQLVVYQVSGFSAIDWINGSTCYSLIDSSGKKDTSPLKTILRQARHNFGTRKIFSLPLGQRLTIRNKNIWLADKQRVPPAPDSTLIDLLVVGQRAPFRGEEWVLGRRIGKVIIDGSTGIRTRKQWIDLLDSLAIEVYDTRSQGAFVSSLR
ncbi:MAG: ComEC/Rec2 family competence protein [Sphingomonadales bacterium]